MAGEAWTREDADDLREAVGEFVRAGRRHDVIPRPQATVLGYLDREGAQTIAELARLTGVRHQSMRVTVAALEEIGALTLAPSADDGRKLICSLTPAGRAKLDEDREARTTWILEAARQLTPDQRAVIGQLAPLLRALSAEPAPPHA